MIWILLGVVIIFIIGARIFIDIREQKVNAKDRRELELNPLHIKFKVLINEIDKTIFNGKGVIIKTDYQKIEIKQSNSTITISVSYSKGVLKIIAYLNKKGELIPHVESFDDPWNLTDQQQIDISANFILEFVKTVKYYNNPYGRMVSIKNNKQTAKNSEYDDSLQLKKLIKSANITNEIPKEVYEPIRTSHTANKTNHSLPKPIQVEISNSDNDNYRNEFAEILYEFSMDQNALESLKEIESADPLEYYNHCLELLQNIVKSKTGVNFRVNSCNCTFKTLKISLKPMIVELSKGRGKLLFISNDLGDVYKNNEGRVICSNKFIILGIEKRKLSRWLYMQLSGRIHEPKLFMLTDNDILDCGTLPDASFETVFKELDRRLEKTATLDDSENLMDEFYNKI